MRSKPHKNVIIKSLVGEAKKGKTDAVQALQDTANSNAPAADEAAEALRKLGKDNN